ncbi:SIS domain-containing protein, partial [Patescibacteria group bacterium]
NQQIYKKLDPGQVGASMELLPDQMREVLSEARLIKVPYEYSKITNVVINGMGGSNLGAHIVKSLFSDQIKVPVNIEPGYYVPNYVNKNTLFIISSYSGTTEEPLSTYKEAKKRGAKIVAITARGKGKLEKLMMKENIPGYIFTPQYNPSGQPRLGVGYSIFGMATLMAKAGLFKIKVREIVDIIASLEIWTRRLRPESPLAMNKAKKLAQAICGKAIVLVGAEFAAGNLHVMRNHINECSKYFATYLTLPELNHYAMEGLTFPKSNQKNLIFVFFDSKFYHPRVQKRSQLTKQVVKKNKIEVLSHELKGETKLVQGFELLQLGMWLSYYLGILNGVDPAKIAWVDWFKNELK